jgi:glycosyltransferase involved in cell wall biosynthesis
MSSCIRQTQVDSGSARPPLVLIFLPTLASGGAERQAAELALHLNRERFEPVVVVLYSFDDVPAEIDMGEIRVLSLRKPLGKLGNLVALFRLWKLIRRERPTIVQSFLRPADLYLRLAAPLAGHHLIITSLRTRIAGFWSLPWQRVEKMLWIFSTCIVSNSTRAAQEAEELIGIPALRLRVIPNGVDLDRFRPTLDWRTPRTKYGLAPSDLVFGMVARYSPVKDHATLLEAIARLRAEGEWPPFARVLLAGGTTYPESRQAVEDRVRELGLSDIVLPTGVAEDVTDVYAAIDWLILPSRFEGFPNSVLEAMACGKPVILSEAANAEGIIVEGETGYSFPTGDSRVLTECLRRALALSAESRVAMGWKARAMVEGRHSIGLMVRRFEALYEELLHRP